MQLASPDRVEAPDRRPPVEVDEDAAAVVVGGRDDRDRLVRDVDPELRAARGDHREPLADAEAVVRLEVAREVEVDAGLAALGHLRDDRARHDVARREVLRRRS